MKRLALVALVVGALTLTPSPPAGQGGPADPAPAGGLTVLPTSAGAGPNLVTNGVFEAPREGTLTGWGQRLDGDLWAVVPEGREGRSALRLNGSRPSPKLPSIEQAVTLEPGLYTIEGWVKTQDVGGNEARSGVRLCLDARPQGNWWQCTAVARGTKDWTQLRVPDIPVKDKGAYKVWLGVYGTAAGTAWFDNVTLTGARKPPLDVYLLYPNFRGMLFDDRAQAVRAAVTSNGTGRVRLSLLEEASGQSRASREFPGGGAFTGELDTAALAAGRY